MSNIIGNKIFAYIDNHNQLTASMIEQYKNAIIVLGDEKQAYIPILSSYIGVSQSYVNSLSERINNTNNSLDEYNNFIHNDVVTSIYAQFTPEELKNYSNGVDKQLRGLTINNDTAYSAFRTKRDIIIKGLNNNNELNSSSFTPINSGINVTLNRGLEEKSGITTINGKQYSFSYYVPYDVLNIDDTYTFSYIENSNSYIIQFVADFASQQADRVYKNLLGENSTIYIEKEFEEAFIKETGTLKEIRQVYVKVKNNNIGNPDENGYARITIDDYNNIKLANSNTIIKYADGTTPPGIKDILAPIGGYDELVDAYGNTIYEPIWYHRDNNNTSTYNMSINDGIETLKEVAYILDQITNGDDSGINLAYNISYNYIEIQKLKEWQDGIGNETVSAFKSESNNELLTVNYYSNNLYGDKDRDNEGFSTGKVKLDLNLVLAQTYILNDVTYAAYLNNHAGANKTYYIINNDPTNTDNYKQANIDIFNFIKAADPSKTIYYYNKVGNYFENTGQAATAQNINNNANYYLYCPYELSYYNFTKGLTTVKWVTSYVREVYNDLDYRINNLNVSDQIRDAIDLLDYSDTNESNKGMFVSKVDENNGIISVTKSKLPLSYIIHNDIISNEDIYLNLTFLDAKSHKDSGNIYRLVNNQYTLINSGDNIWTNGDNLKYDNLYYKISISSMVQVDTNTNYLNLINNVGNTSYFFKDDTTNKTIYTPIDIQEMNTSSNLSSYIGNGQIYYWNKTGARIKYFDAYTIQNYDGSTTTTINSYITTLSMASPTNSGLADAWDVRHTIENMFKWVDIKTNKIIG